MVLRGDAGFGAGRRGVGCKPAPTDTVVRDTMQGVRRGEDTIFLTRSEGVGWYGGHHSFENAGVHGLGHSF